MAVLTDKLGRIHNYIRISLTDKCNLNCSYCNPSSHGYQKLQKDNILNYGELIRLIKIFLFNFHIKKLRFTGGEPLVRKGILDFFELLHDVKIKEDFEFCLTTNGTLLKDKIIKLKELGLSKLNISLDTLNSEKYERLTGNNSHENVISAVQRAEELGFDKLKLNVVVIKGINDGEILDFVDFIKWRNITVRFIEYMPFNGNDWNKKAFMNSEEIKDTIIKKYPLVKIKDNGNQVALDYNIKGYKGEVGFISSISNHFCERCNRIRIKSNGQLKLCLYSKDNDEFDLRKYLRDSSFSDSDIAHFISEKLQLKEKELSGVDKLISLEKNNMVSIGG
jgi:cyclic pyranopterin phosphate synthase